jgi:translation initiation factor 2 subunit 1
VTSEQAQVLPEIGELVVGTVVRIVPYGSYVTLDEYNNVEGLLHISEVSSGWVRNIGEHIREGQKTVLKVLRTDPQKMHVDLSLRRVSEREKKDKLLDWKQENRGRRLLDMAAEKIKISPDEAYQKVGTVIEEKFGNIYKGLERVLVDGQEPLIKAGVPPEWAQALEDVAKSRIRIHRVQIRGTLQLMSNGSKGVETLHEAFQKALSVRKPKNAQVEIYTVGPPRYRIEVVAENFKQAERILDNAVQAAVETMTSHGGEGKFTRKDGQE